MQKLCAGTSIRCTDALRCSKHDSTSAVYVVLKLPLPISQRHCHTLQPTGTALPVCCCRVPFAGIMRAATGFEPSDKWFGQQAVYRISMGNFLFFGSMSLALLGVKYKGDKRGQVLQQGNWMIKLVVWVLFMALPFLFPNGLVQAYGEQQHSSCCRKGRIRWS